jgi:hypothetical protein
MTAPAQAALQFAQGLGLGLCLGFLYGFLRPLRRHWAALGDLIFIVAAFWAWLQLSFGICRGDIRLGITASLALGALIWELTAGRLLRRPIALLWQTLGHLIALFLRPVKYFLQIIHKICKKVFASAKKWGTIGWNSCRHRRHKPGGIAHEEQEKKRTFFQYQTGLPAGQQSDQDRSAGSHRLFHRRSGDHSRGH